MPPGWPPSEGFLMNAPAQLPALLPVLPEIVLAVGAMALLMFGVYWRGERLGTLTNTLAIALLLVTGLLVAFLPNEAKAVTFGGSFVLDGFARVMKILSLIGSAAAIAMSPSYLAAEKQDKFEYAIL